MLLAHSGYFAVVLAPGGINQGFAAFRIGPIGNLVYSFCELAVPMFFAMSAYLIGRPFVLAFVFGDKRPSTRTYARHRFWRIVPVFWAGIVAALIVCDHFGAGPLDLLAIFGFAQTYHNSLFASLAIGQAWTLDVEIAFYVIVPLLFWVAFGLGRRATPKQRLVWFVVVLSGMFFASVWARGHGPSLSGGWVASPPAMICMFIPGLLLAALEIVVRPWAERSQRQARRIARLLAAGFAACALVYALLAPWSGPPSLLYDVTGKRTFFVITATALLVGWLLLRQWSGGGTPRVLDQRWSHWLGARSLSFYILHQAVLLKLNPWVIDQHSVRKGFLVFFSLGLLITTVAAAALYWLVEGRFMVGGTRDQRRRAAAPPTAPAAPIPIASVAAEQGSAAS